VQSPRLLFFNRELADELGLGLERHDDAALAALFSGNALPEGATAHRPGLCRAPVRQLLAAAR
jgi:uncharacterized protein YdiU (UPF0061 family)